MGGVKEKREGLNRGREKDRKNGRQEKRKITSPGSSVDPTDGLPRVLNGCCLGLTGPFFCRTVFPAWS